MNSDTSQPNQPANNRPFIPIGVDAGSWIGFERRIQERRFQALLEAAHEALGAGNHAAAREALREARTLRPDAVELNELERRADTPVSDRERRRMPHAAALLAVGVALILAVDALRAPVATPDVPAAPASVQFHLPDPVATTGVLDEVAPYHQATPYEQTLRAREPLGEPVRAALLVRELPTPQPRTRPTATPADLFREPAITPVAPAAPPAVEVATVSAPRLTTPESTATIAVPTASTAAAAPMSAPGPALVVTAPPADESLVTSTLRRYARAYTELDARAARDVWPTVDERALSSAFAGLRSQSLDFQNCEVVVRQVEADAVCRGTASYVTRVGSSSPRVEPRTWHFELSRRGDEWLIDSAVARR